MLFDAIKTLKISLSNLNLPIKKCIICFKPLIEKEETGKQTAGTLYNKN